MASSSSQLSTSSPNTTRSRSPRSSAHPYPRRALSGPSTSTSLNPFMASDGPCMRPPCAAAAATNDKVKQPSTQVEVLLNTSTTSNCASASYTKSSFPYTPKPKTTSQPLTQPLIPPTKPPPPPPLHAPHPPHCSPHHSLPQGSSTTQSATQSPSSRSHSRYRGPCPTGCPALAR